MPNDVTQETQERYETQEADQQRLASSDSDGTKTDGRSKDMTTSTSTKENQTATRAGANENHPNPFRSVARLLKSVDTALKAPAPGKTDVRWVRIVRVRQFAKLEGGALKIEENKNLMGRGALEAVDKFAWLIGQLMRFTLEARDLLIQGDALKALFDVSCELLEAATDDDTINSLTEVAGLTIESGFGKPVKEALGDIKKFVNKVPDPQDLDDIGEALYNLLRIDFKETGDNKDIDKEKTGRLRLLCWGLHKPFPVFIGGKEIPVLRLGARDMTQSSSEDDTIKIDINNQNGKEIVVDLDFKARDPIKSASQLDYSQTNDFFQVNTILEALGYNNTNAMEVKDKNKYTDGLKERVKAFQIKNEIYARDDKQLGILDLPTIHLLMNLDTKNRNILRAKPYDGSTAAPSNPA